MFWGPKALLVVLIGPTFLYIIIWLGWQGRGEGGGGGGRLYRGVGEKCLGKWEDVESWLLYNHFGVQSWDYWWKNSKVTPPVVPASVY